MKKRCSLRKPIFLMLTATLVLALTGLWPGSSSSAGPEAKKFLADRHQAKGVTCTSCHKESPPKAAVPTTVCLGCHGSYAKVAERTINVSPNPHASHMGVQPCESCHHAHKKPENLCSSCHEFEMKVP